MLDGKGYYEFYQERKQSGLPAELDLNDMMQVRNSFMASAHGVETWANSHQVLLFDPTHRTHHIHTHNAAPSPGDRMAARRRERLRRGARRRKPGGAWTQADAEAATHRRAYIHSETELNELEIR